MKKLLLVIISCFAVFCSGASFAACEPQSGWGSAINGNDNLNYETPNGEKFTFECEKGKCEDGDLVTIASNNIILIGRNRSNDVWRGIFKCVFGSDDHWERVDSFYFCPRQPDDCEEYGGLWKIKSGSGTFFGAAGEHCVVCVGYNKPSTDQSGGGQTDEGSSGSSSSSGSNSSSSSSSSSGSSSSSSSSSSTGSKTSSKTNKTKPSSSSSSSSSGAAGAQENDLCVTVNEKRDKNDVTEILGSVNGAPYSYVTIYFDTAKAEVSEKCRAKVDDVINAMQKNLDNVQHLVFIGSADEQNGRNDVLSKNRAEGISSRFNCTQSTCSVFVTGDENAKMYSDKKVTDKLGYRTVDIFVIWRLAQCKAETMNLVNSTKIGLRGYTGDKRGKLNDLFADLESICPQAGKILSAAESEKYENYLAQMASIAAEIKRENPNLSIPEAITYIEHYNKITKMRNEWFGKVNVWKNAEGKFNTARLASDSIAGVVLGTAGGLITSHLVKKNQVKTGFEDIQCTVGGQKVADWGDEFMVGIR